jgi:hypothetical protein
MNAVRIHALVDVSVSLQYQCDGPTLWAAELCLLKKFAAVTSTCLYGLHLLTGIQDGWQRRLPLMPAGVPIM